MLSICVLSAHSSLTPCDPMDYIAHKYPLSMEFLRQEYWGGLPYPTLADLPDPGIEPISPVSLVLAGRFFTTVSLGKPFKYPESVKVKVLVVQSHSLQPHGL